MADIMRVDPDRLRDAEPNFRYLSSSLAAAFADLAGVLDSAGPCWGTDRIGAGFAESYLPIAQLVRETLPKLRDDVADVGDAIRAVADNADAVELRAQARLT
jgi:uncharacterized protein YukE